MVFFCEMDPLQTQTFVTLFLVFFEGFPKNDRKYHMIHLYSKIKI